MRRVGSFILGIACLAVPAQAQSPLEQGFAGALRGCETWVLQPASWSEGLAPFIAAVGLGDTISLVDRIAQEALPPEPLRVANHYWRINSAPDAGYILVVSDRLPMCHITGGGSVDLQPVTEAILASPAFQARWTPIAEKSEGDLLSSRFRNREDPALTITVSRAQTAGQRTDRVQLLATATYDLPE